MTTEKKEALEMLKEELEWAKSDLLEAQKELDSFELDPYDYEESYNEMLDEYEIKIGNISFYGSRILSQLDPIAYRCGINDYIDGLDVADDPKYKEIQEEIEAIENTISDLEEKIEEIKGE